MDCGLFLSVEKIIDKTEEIIESDGKRIQNIPEPFFIERCPFERSSVKIEQLAVGKLQARALAYLQNSHFNHVTLEIPPSVLAKP